MRCFKSLFVVAIAMVVLGPQHADAQQRNYISRHSVNRLFGGRSRLLVATRPTRSLFSVTDFWSNEGNPEVQPAEAPQALMQWMPVEPETIQRVVPAPMTFTEHAIIEPVQHTLPKVTPGEPGHSLQPPQQPTRLTIELAAPLPATVLPEPAAEDVPNFEDMFDDSPMQPPEVPQPGPVVNAAELFEELEDATSQFEEQEESTDDAAVFVEPLPQTTELEVRPITQTTPAEPEAGETPALPIDISFPPEEPPPFDAEPVVVENSIDEPSAQVEIDAPVVGIPTPQAVELNQSSINEQIRKLEADNGDAETRSSSIELYQQALQHLDASAKAADEADRLEASYNDIPQQLTQATKALQSARAAAGMEPTFDGIGLTQLNDEVTNLQTALPTLEEERSTLAAQLKQIQDRVSASEETKVNLLDAIELAEQVAADGTDALATATRIESEARATMLRNQLALSAVQVRTDTESSKLVETQLDYADVRLDQVRSRLATAQRAADDIQQRIAEEESNRAQQVAAQVPAELKRFADDNAALAEQLAWLKSHIAETRTQTAAAKALNVRLTRSLERVRDIQARTGLNTTLGLILNHELEHMPSARKWQRQISGIEDDLHKLSEIEFAIERKDRLRERFVSDATEATALLIRQNPGRQESLQKISGELTASHEKLLSDAVTTAQMYSEGLTTLDFECEGLVETIHEFESHINKNVLWIRSNEPLSVADFAAFGPMTQQFSSGKLWVETLRSLLNAIQENIVVLAICAFFVLVVMSFGDEFLSRLKRLGDLSSVDDQVQLRPMWEALAITAVLVGSWPALFWAFGSAVSNSLTSTDLAIAMGFGLQTVAIWMLTFKSARWVCCPNGLAHRHFGWRESGLRFIHEGLPKVMVWGLPVVMIVATLSQFDHARWSGSVGRIVFICGSLGLAFFLRRGLNPTTGLLTRCCDAGSWMARLKYPALIVGVLLPLTLAVTSAAGYHHSSLQLAGCLEQTWMMGVGLLVIFGLTVRCLDWVIQSLETGKSVRELAFKARAFNPDSPEVEEAEEQRRELATNREQVYRFLSIGTAVCAVVGCWVIWHNVLPALNVVNDIQLWTMTKDVPVATDAPGAAVQTIKQTVPITLGDLIRAMIVLVLTIAAARNLPGLLDTFVLRRLPLDRGGRHAISTISRYVLTTVGLLLTLRQVGVDWASMQWLVAAMTVGLGFGLQEIFANFVSGLIILLERPIRLGDFVTVNGETGFVTRIQFRATTITDLDRRELLVPNKKFITDELINWTLSDPITRLVLPVGIAYGSDTSLVHKLLLEAANEHPVVLKEPEASAVMTEFGDSTLNYELRVFIPRRDEFAQILHELNTAIDRKFRAQNVEIAFPQCDINVRGLEQLAAVTKRAA